MAARHQNDNATMLSIESLYQQSEVVRTSKVSQPESARPAMKRRKRYSLPLINSKPLASFLSDNGAGASPDGLDGLVLSGLKIPAVEQDSSLPKSLNLGHVKTAITRQSREADNQHTLQGGQEDTDSDPASDENPDPMLAIRQAVMTAADSHGQPAGEDERHLEKSALQKDIQSLISKLVMIIEEEVEDRLVRQNMSKQSASRPASPAGTSQQNARTKRPAKKISKKMPAKKAATKKTPSGTRNKTDRR